MKHPVESIHIIFTRKYVSFYAGDLLVHRIKQVLDDRCHISEYVVKYWHENPHVKGNRLYVTKTESDFGRRGRSRLVSFPLKADVLHELKKMKRKVITEKLERNA